MEVHFNSGGPRALQQDIAAAWRCAGRACKGLVYVGTSAIRVRRALRVSCRRTKGLAEDAVKFRVSKGFPKRFCLGNRVEYCWQFGEPMGDEPGESRTPFTGRNGKRRIRAVQIVS